MTAPTRRFLRQRHFRLEILEDRSVPSTAPILMENGADHSVAHWGEEPNPSQLAFVCSLWESSGIISRNIYGNKIDFNKDGYADVIEMGRRDQLVGYNDSGTHPPSIASSRFGIGIVGLGGPNGLTYNNKTPGINQGFTGQWIGSDAVAADVNLDGYDDLVILQRTSDTGRGARIETQLWDPAQSKFGSATTVCTLDAYADKFGSMQFGDVNGDGVPDLVLPNFSSSVVDNHYEYTGMQVFLGKRDGSGHWNGAVESTAWTTVAAYNPSKEWGILLTGGEMDRTLSNPSITAALVDLNGDGKLDLAVPSPVGITVFTNPGDGKFVPISSVFTPVPKGTLGGQQLWTGDFNNDGKMDLVSSPNLTYAGLWEDTAPTVRNWTANTSPITLYLNTTPTGGPSSFTASSVNAFDSSGGFNGQLVVADFNLDGNLDLAVASASNASVYFGTLQGNGDGTFGTMALHSGYTNDADGYVNSFTRGIRGIGVADINNDGLLDIATATYNYGVPQSSSGLNNPAVGITGVSFNASFTKPAVSNTTLADGTQGQPYTGQLIGTGGDPTLPYVFSLNKNSQLLPNGLVLLSSGEITGTPTQSGPFQILVDVAQANGLKGSTLVTLVVNPGHVILSTPIIVTAPRIGGEPIHVLKPDGTLLAAFVPFFGYGGNVRVGTGDVTNDGIVDILAISCGGITTMVRVFDGVTHALIREFAPYGAGFKNGGFIAVGDVLANHAGYEIVVSPAAGRVPVRVFDANGVLLSSFAPYSPKYAGAVPMTVANIDGRAGDEIITVIGHGRSQVRWFNGQGDLLGRFNALGDRIAAGDVDGDGKVEIVLTNSAGLRPVVRIYDPNHGGLLNKQFYAFTPAYRGGLEVTLVRRADGSRYDIVTSLQAKRPTLVSMFDGMTGASLDRFLAYSNVFSFGLNIAGG